ncbi:unnamed protein product [Euphydryas editha]|uniref:MADF domain-containing protein n=1 Tax=Euphydryas editha TaxID=104508 RepID=A0AAU9TRR4_EUPED|nr:unnamed protein product [Euphydryas editha]
MPKLADEINLKFVQLYREEECLWNASIPSYKDKQMRDSSLEKIRDILNKDGIEMSIKEIKNKIKNLRATYCQELTKIEKSERSEAGTAEVYKPKIIWFEEMHNFIKKVPMKRKTSNNQDSPNNNKDDNSASNSQSLEPPVAENLSEKTVEMSQPASEMSSIQDKTSKFISPGIFCIKMASSSQETDKNKEFIRKTICSSARQVIFNVFQQCFAEYQAGRILIELDARTAAMTGM